MAVLMPIYDLTERHRLTLMTESIEHPGPRAAQARLQPDRDHHRGRADRRHRRLRRHAILGGGDRGKVKPREGAGDRRSRTRSSSTRRTPAHCRDRSTRWSRPATPTAGSALRQDRRAQDPWNKPIEYRAPGRRHGPSTCSAWARTASPAARASTATSSSP